MGYRSDWRIVINSHGHTDRVKSTLKQYIATHNSDASKLLEQMMNNSDINETGDVLDMSGDSWKLYEWDNVTSIISNLFDGDHEIDIAWSRLGEDYSDTEIRTGAFTDVFVNRSIDYGISTVPRSYHASDEDEDGTASVPKEPCRCDINHLFSGMGHDPSCSERK